MNGPRAPTQRGVGIEWQRQCTRLRTGKGHAVKEQRYAARALPCTGLCGDERGTKPDGAGPVENAAVLEGGGAAGELEGAVRQGILDEGTRFITQVPVGIPACGASTGRLDDAPAVIEYHRGVLVMTER